MIHRRASMVPVARISIGLAIGLAIAAASCHRGAPTARERVLAALPADAVAVIVADGAALSHPRSRGVLDAVAARWPSALGCLVDAAVASDAVGASLDGADNLTLIFALSRTVRCPALSQRAPGLWIATLGEAPAVRASVLDDPRFARARPYLATSPIAAVVLGEVHVLAAAQPEPFDAWVAIDAPGGVDPIAREIAERVARIAREPDAAAIAAGLHIARTGATQLVVRLTGAFDRELAAAARIALTWTDALASARAPTGPAAFACPPAAADVACTDGIRYRMGSLATGLSAILDVGQPMPIVVNGSVAGLRLHAAVRQLGLEAGDVVVAMAGRLMTSRTMLADSIAHARNATTVTVRRRGAEAVLEFAEH